MNQFGGSWTESKMEIVVAYAKAYLTIMNKQTWAKTLYFDGFAGSGAIEANEDEEVIKGTALRILDINDPKSFDLYYFVEKDEKNKLELQAKIDRDYPDKKRIAPVVQADCNIKMIDMAKFLKENNNYRALAFIDPLVPAGSPNGDPAQSCRSAYLSSGSLTGDPEGTVSMDLLA